MVTLDAQLFFLAGLLLIAYPIYRGIRAYLHSRGTRIVKCPETTTAAAVEADALLYASAFARGDYQLCLKDCSRWPERKDCDQACLMQIELAPDGCLLRNILDIWYSEKSCVLCGRKFEKIRWHDHKPSLMDEAGEVKSWDEFAPEAIPATLDTHRPVCWNCHVAEDFRQKFPELVVDRRGSRERTRGVQ